MEISFKNERKLEKLLKSLFENEKPEKIKDFLQKKAIIKTYEKEFPAIKHLSLKGVKNIITLIKEKNLNWNEVKEKINTTPELKDLKNEINECKIKEQKAIKNNKNISMGLGE